jgi:hypothetical protein
MPALRLALSGTAFQLTPFLEFYVLFARSISALVPPSSRKMWVFE